MKLSGLSSKLRHREGLLTVSFFLLKTGMATVVRSIRLCASEVVSSWGGEGRGQRSEGRGQRRSGPRCLLAPYSGSVGTPLSPPLADRRGREAKGSEQECQGKTGGPGRRLSKSSV